MTCSVAKATMVVVFSVGKWGYALHRTAGVPIRREGRLPLPYEYRACHGQAHRLRDLDLFRVSGIFIWGRRQAVQGNRSAAGAPRRQGIGGMDGASSGLSHAAHLVLTESPECCHAGDDLWLETIGLQPRHGRHSAIWNVACRAGTRQSATVSTHGDAKSPRNATFIKIAFNAYAMP